MGVPVLHIKTKGLAFGMMYLAFSEEKTPFSVVSWTGPALETDGLSISQTKVFNSGIKVQGTAVKLLLPPILFCL